MGRATSSSTNKAKLSLKIKNFGPITSGAINLKPLTVFTGDNNSGKSYAALLIHSIFYSERSFARWHPYRIAKVFSNEIQTKFKNLQNSSSTISSFDTTISDDMLYGQLQLEINKNFGTVISKLIQIGQTACALDISTNLVTSKLSFSDNKLNTQQSSGLKIPVKIDLTKVDRPSIHDNRIVIYDYNFGGQHLFDRVTHGLLYDYWRTTTIDSWYLPASRNGILQGHRALSAGIIANSSLAGIKDIRIPKMSGAVTGLLQNVQQLPGPQGSLGKIAKHLQRMTRGNISVSDTKPTPEIKYKFHGRPMQLHLTSSTVSEVAPLVLYLKYLVEPGSLLIIEEPESHLHPDNQIVMAECIVELVRAGVFVLVTTHSPYFVESLANFLKSSKLTLASRKQVIGGYGKCYIDPDELAVYSFELDQDFSTINSIERSIDDGIQQTRFFKTFQSIRERSISIEEYNEST